jgi:uncharacterized protein YodC (DUF2158 family)
MKFKYGDVVIKKTGGNKMTVTDHYEYEFGKDHYKCYWFVESKLNEFIFEESDLLTLEEYKLVLKSEERSDKLNKLLS